MEMSRKQTYLSGTQGEIKEVWDKHFDLAIIDINGKRSFRDIKE